MQCGLFQCKALDGTRLLRNLMSELGEFKINMAGIKTLHLLPELVEGTG